MNPIVDRSLNYGSEVSIIGPALGPLNEPGDRANLRLDEVRQK